MEPYLISMLKSLKSKIDDAKRVGYMNPDEIKRYQAAYEGLFSKLKEKKFLSTYAQRLLLDLILRVKAKRYYYDNPKVPVKDEDLVFVDPGKGFTDTELFGGSDTMKQRKVVRYL